MRSSIVVTLLALSVLLVSACTKTTDKGPAGDDKTKIKDHAKETTFSADENFNFIDVIKRKTLPGYTEIPIGTAFDSFPYFTRHNWKDNRAANGAVYIDFIGWFDATRGLGAKFVIRRDSTYGLVMMSRLEARADGSVTAYPLEDFKGVLRQLYGKKEIRF